MACDPLQIVREYLLRAGSPLAELGAQVFYPHLPDNPDGRGSVWDNTTPGVLLVGIGGEALAGPNGMSIDVEVRCFGGGQEVRKQARKAWQCYEALRASLGDTENWATGKRLSSGNLISADEEKTGTHETEPGLNWPFVSSNWTFEVSAST